MKTLAPNPSAATATGTAMTARLDELEHDPVALEGREHRLLKLDDLRASIPEYGIIQSLRVRPWIGAQVDGLPKYGVVGGNRRLATLRALMAEGGTADKVPVTPDLAVPVVFGELGDEKAFEISVAENEQRLPPTPVQEFRDYAKMARTKPNAEIALAFGVTEQRVRQRLKLAALHPEVLAALDGGKITLEAAQAFTVGEPKKQQKYLAKAGGNNWLLTPDKIKAAFTQKLVPATSKLAQLVGRDAYVAAGGELFEDSFTGVTYWTSNDVLNGLVAALWADRIDAWQAEGWGFVAEAKEYGQYFYGGNRLDPEVMPLSPEGEAALAQIRGRLVELHRQYAFQEIDEVAWETACEPEGFDDTDFPEPPPEIAAEIAQLDKQLQGLETGRDYFSAEQKAGSGVVYTADGSNEPWFGVIDEKRVAPPKGTAPKEKPANLKDVSYETGAVLKAAATAALRKAAAGNVPAAIQLLAAKLHFQLVGGSTYNTYGVSIDAGYHGGTLAGYPDRGSDFPAALAWAREQTKADLVKLIAGFVAATLTVTNDPGSRAAIEDLLAPDAAATFDAEAYFKTLSGAQCALAAKQMGGDVKTTPKALTERAVETAWLPPQLRGEDYAGPGAGKKRKGKTVEDGESEPALEAAE